MEEGHAGIDTGGGGTRNDEKVKAHGKRVPFSILYENVTKWVFAHAGRHLLRPGHLCVT